MLKISFGETVINASNATIDRLIISRDVINNTPYKNVFLVMKNATLIIGDINDTKLLLIEDSDNNLTIFNSSITLQNMEVNEREGEVLYQYTFRESL
jgi:hypothetical protein